MPRTICRHPRWLSAALAALLLYAQLAVAAYACPMLAGPDQSVVPASASFPCAEMRGAGGSSGDVEQSALCLEHCRFGTQAADQGHAPALLTLPALAASSFLLTLQCSAVTEASSAVRAQWLTRARDRERSPPPPHALLHCCLRT